MARRHAGPGRQRPHAARRLRRRLPGLGVLAGLGLNGPAATRGTSYLRQAAIWVAVGLAVYSVGAAVLLILAEDPLHALDSLAPWALPLYVCAATVAFTLRTWRWLILVRAAGVTGPVPALAATYLGGFVLTLSPGRIGELWRAWALQRGHGLDYPRGMALVFTDRLLDLVTLLAFATAGLAVGLGAPFAWPATVAGLALAGIVVLAVIPGWAQGCLKMCWGLAGKPAPRLFVAIMRAMRTVGSALVSRRGPGLLALSVLAWGCEALAMAVVALTAGTALDLQTAAATLGLANLAGALSHLPAGIGGQELAMVHLLEVAGLALVGAVALVACHRLGTLWFSILLGLPFFVRLTRRHAAGR